MPIIAAIDIGANSVRLKIARLKGQRLEMLREDREVTRLGQSVFATGLLEPQAMARTVKVLRRFHRSAQALGAEYVRVVATSALRYARNARAFIDWVAAATGWRVEVISGFEEGRLIHLGVTSAMRLRGRRGLLIDLGGGSCELTLSEDGQIRSMSSLPLGAVRLTQEFLHHDPPKKRELERLREFINEEVARIKPRLTTPRPETVIATSGTAAALASVAAARQRGSKRKLAVVSSATVHKLARELQKYSLQQRVGIPGIGPRRAEIITAGAAVFAELMNHLPGFRYSPLGLRDGLLAQMAADYGEGGPVRKRIESERWNALHVAGKHYGIDIKYAEVVRELALQLFAGLRAVHQLAPEYEQWLGAAAMLHEVGSYINRSGRHRHTYYIITHSEIFGYGLQQRRLMAAIARYVGRSRPAASDGALKMLRPADREMVPKAVALLRLARALNQSRRGAVKQVRARVQDGSVTLKLQTKRGGAALELWAVEKERSYFRAVLGRSLSAVVES